MRTERKFFKHFVIDSQKGAGSKSILFRNFVRKEREQQANAEFADVASFVAALRAVHEHLAKFLLQELTFDEVMEIGSILQAENRSPERELQLLSAYFSRVSLNGQLMRMDVDAARQLTTVLRLCGLREPLSSLVLSSASNDGEELPGTLERYNFKCAGTPRNASSRDADYMALKELSASLCDPQTTRSWDISECERRLEQVRVMLHPNGEDVTHEALLGMLNLFVHLAASEKVWEFVHLHKDAYVSPGGDGYTAAFDFKIEDFLAQLGGEDYRVVENFKPVVNWVATLVSNQNKSFNELMRSLWASKTIAAQAVDAPETKPFSQLITANSNMDFLSDLFRNGLGGLDSVLPQFQSVDACCIYVFNLANAKITLEYADERKKAWVPLDEEEVADFVQRLGFVQTEEKAQNYAIEPFLLTLQEHRRALALMCELHALGHPEYTMPICIRTAGKVPRGIALRSAPSWLLEQQQCGSARRLKPHEEMPATLERTCTIWKDHLDQILEANKLLCFFSTLTAQRMATLIATQSHYDLALLISPLFPLTKVRADCFRLLQQQVEPACAKCNETSSTASEQWPAITATFLEVITNQMSASGVASAVDKVSVTSPALADGPIRYSAAPSHSVLVRLLLHICDGAPPEPYEVLWCDKSTTPRMLRAFLERAKHHPHRRFVLLQVDLIAHTLQHVLVRLFLDTRDTKPGQLRAGHNIRCVETGPSALQSATWIRLENADELCEGIDLKSVLSQSAVGRGDPVNVTCYHGPPGSGKTHQMRKRISQLSTSTFVCSLSITEAFSIGDAAKKLHEAALCAKGKSLALCVSINVGKFKRSERGEWSALMEKVSKLFVGILVLRSVEDPLSDVVFNVPPGCKLEVFVEIPDRDAHLEPPPNGLALDDSDRVIRDFKLLQDEIPVLAALGAFEDAEASPFEISDDTKHVCKYLKAADDGSIDQTFGSGAGGPKVRATFCLEHDLQAHAPDCHITAISLQDVFFVLDHSGSMGADVGGRNRL